MNFKQIIFLIMVVLSSIKVSGQLNPQLSGFTFSKEKLLVGKYIGGPTGKLILSGDGASNFHLKGDKLYISKKAAAHPWFDVAISNGIRIDTFRTVRDDFVKNEVVAHRGAWKNTGETENSLGSLKKAIELGCSGSETDVHLSADSVIYIHHDPKLQDVTIEKAGSAELSRLKLSNGEPLPTLDSYLTEVMKQNKTRLILEVKASVISKERSLTLTKKVLEMVRRHKAEAWITYISFDWDVCKLIREMQPFANIEYLNGDKSVDDLVQAKINGLDYHCSVLKKDGSIFSQAKQKHIDVNVWTVNTEADMDWLLANKVDFITTNEPEILLKRIRK